MAKDSWGPPAPLQYKEQVKLIDRWRNQIQVILICYFKYQQMHLKSKQKHGKKIPFEFRSQYSTYLLTKWFATVVLQKSHFVPATWPSWWPGTKSPRTYQNCFMFTRWCWSCWDVTTRLENNDATEKQASPHELVTFVLQWLMPPLMTHINVYVCVFLIVILYVYVYNKY